MTSQLTSEAIDGLAARGISDETALRYGARTSTDGRAIEFPYLETGREVNCKSRAPADVSKDKTRMWQVAGGEQTLWNVDILEDPDLYRAEDPVPLIVTEGEIDALSFIEAGYERVASVPNGAPNAVRDGPINDEQGDFVWCRRHWERLRQVRQIILATDGDHNGQNLAQELVRRFGPARCLFVTYPAGSKDANEVLVKHGRDGIAALVAGAQPYPTKGLYTLDQLPQTPDRHPVSTGWNVLDEGIRPYLGEFIVMVGIPGCGKSTFLTALMSNLSREHGWKVCLGSLENEPRDYETELKRYYLRKHPVYALQDERAEAEQWVRQNFLFATQNVETDDDEMDLSEFLNCAEAAVVQHGVKLVVLDPFNQLESRRGFDETETEHTAKSIRAMMRFARRHQVCFICVVHPTKDARNHKPENLGLYDCAGSAHWANKPQAGLVLWRLPNSNELHIRVAKLRYRDTGRQWHQCSLFLEENSGRYSEVDIEADDMFNAA